MPGPVFGHIPRYPVGSRFESHAELSEAGVHRHRQAGISGSASEGADSIVLSGGYEDDLDNGDEIVYTGHGGRDQETNKQIADQNFSRWNRALAYSSLNGLRFGSLGVPVTTRRILPAPGTVTTGYTWWTTTGTRRGDPAFGSGATGL